MSTPSSTTEGKVLLPAVGNVGLWAVGQRYAGADGSYQSGSVWGRVSIMFKELFKSHSARESKDQVGPR
ncbi:hypothetical protein NKR19_g8796 [Coniochaeta hoffmannii]|uniref:Uncharacterized protein n=1 Tax=Coniochaeta hoffmannii TaxID=91930 RepID=A0AA38VLN8_9PEZI|nr:hypothetical protein NKR19_g8796 [Coniochaeta hoffmannii]